MRTLFVWAGGLALYYSSGTGKIGERWDNYSYFQVPPLLYLFLNFRNLSVLQQHWQDRGALGQLLLLPGACLLFTCIFQQPSSSRACLKFSVCTA